MNKVELEKVSGIHYNELSLTKNYRSSSLLVSYFDYFKTYDNMIEAVGKTKDDQSIIYYNQNISIESLVDEIIRIIKYNIEVCGIFQVKYAYLHHNGFTYRL